jgi:hypothetical protein
LKKIILGGNKMEQEEKKLIISKIKLPNKETPYEIYDINAVHIDEAIKPEEIDEICGATDTEGE